MGIENVCRLAQSLYILYGSLDNYKRVFSLRVDCTGECVVLPVAIPCCCTNKQPSRERAGGPRGCHPTLHRLNKHLKHSNRARMTLYDGLGVKGYFGKKVIWGKMSFCLISEKVILFATVHYSPKIRDKNIFTIFNFENAEPTTEKSYF